MDKIIGLGNALVDVLAILNDDEILSTLELPKGSMQLIDDAKLQQINSHFDEMELTIVSGGSVGNSILNLAKLGSKTGFIGKIGKDKFGTYFRESLLENGVQDKLLTCDLPSGVASTFISKDGERTFGTYLGAAASLKAEDLSADLFVDYTFLHIEGYLVQDHKMIETALKLAKEVGLQVCLDLSSYNIVEEERDFLFKLVEKYVDILFANQEEAKAFTGCEPQDALPILARLCSIAIIKLGEDGSLVKKGTHQFHVDAVKVDNVVDTTGAGDAFAAGFLYGLTCGCCLDKCGRIGSLLSSEVIKVIGATVPNERWADIKQTIKEL